MLIWLSKLEFLWPKQNQVPHFQLLKKAWSQEDSHLSPVLHQGWWKYQPTDQVVFRVAFPMFFRSSYGCVPKLGTPKSIKIRWLIIICRLNMVNLGVSSGIWHSPKPPKHPWLHRSCVRCEAQLLRAVGWIELAWNDGRRLGAMMAMSSISGPRRKHVPSGELT